MAGRTKSSAQPLEVQFGYFPDPMDLTAGQLAISTLPGLEEQVRLVSKLRTDGKWVYPPQQTVYDWDRGVVEKPYISRIFALPKTHRLSHKKADGPDHLEFLIWALSFFTGMRLTTTDAGFVDATPSTPRTLVDFVLSPRDYGKAITLAESFWQAHKQNPRQAKRWAAAVHALFIAHYPLALQFERFIYLYTALDACYALTEAIIPPGRRLSHSERLEWMCDHFAVPLPAWGRMLVGPSEIARIRNDAIHEALFVDAPLGFALYGVGTGQNMPLEMEAVICRLLVAIIGVPTNAYVRSPVTTRMMHGLDL